MKLSLIIPTCRRPDELRNCLQAVTRQAEALGEIRPEIIVTDDSPDAAGRSICGAWSQVIYVEGPRRGPAANRNQGARRATGEWIIFLDDDCLPLSGWLAAYVEAMRRTSCRVLEGKVVTNAVLGSNEFAPANLTGGLLWSCNFALRREFFLQIGGFDEHFPFAHLEDVDLRLRLEKAKIPWEFVPDAAVYHPPKKHKPWWHIPWHMESNLYLARKHRLSLIRCGAHPQVLLRHFLRQSVQAETLHDLLSGLARGVFCAMTVALLTPVWYFKACRTIRRQRPSSIACRVSEDEQKDLTGGVRQIG